MVRSILIRLENLDNNDFRKIMVIECNWLVEMIKQMWDLCQKKNYQFSKKKGCTNYEDYKENLTKIFKSPEKNLDYHFDKREFKDKNQLFEDDNPAQNFMSFVRYFEISDKKDFLTLSKEYCDYATISHYLQNISKNKAFSELCRFLINFI